MNRLATQVELLLAYHPCVTVPAFGGFVLQHFPAHFEGEMLCAPRTCVGFNRQLQHDDGLLIGAYARALGGVKYTEAQRAVAADVRALQEQLQEVKMVQFGRIGLFRQEGERLLFVPSEGTFLPNNLGQNAVQASKRCKPMHINAETVTITMRRDTLRRVAACFIGLALLTLAPRTQQESYDTYASLSPVNYAQIIADRNAAIEAARQAELVRIEQEKQRGHFHVIVMTTTPAQAKKVCAKLQQSGYDAKAYTYKKKQNRVAIASYQTKKEALREMQRIRRTTRYKRAWVWCE